MRTFISGILLCLCCSGTQALPGAAQSEDPASRVMLSAAGDVWSNNPWQQLADNATEKTKQPESGSLIIPGENKAQNAKKCLNVCKKWGEDCIINPTTGARNCRRTCKEFGEECFEEKSSGTP